MGSIFNVENPFFQAINKIIDLIILSTIWSLMCSVSVFVGYLIVKEGGYLLFWAALIVALIPVGPATTAMYYAIVKVIRRERGYVIREFFRSFKTNFKQGALFSIILGATAAILYVDYEYVNTLSDQGNSKVSTVMFVIFNIITIIAVLMVMFVFPVLSRFTLSFKALLRNSLIMSIRHLPTTILLFIIVSVFGFGTYLLWPYPTFFLFPGICCLICSFLLEKVFKKYMPKPDQTPEESGQDQWYME